MNLGQSDKQPGQEGIPGSVGVIVHSLALLDRTAPAGEAAPAARLGAISERVSVKRDP